MKIISMLPTQTEPVRYKHKKAEVQPTVFREGSLRKTKPALWLFTNS